MALIGDYIHYKVTNYTEYGTYRKDKSNDGSSYKSAQGIYNTQKEQMLSNINSFKSQNNNNLSELSEKLTQLIYGARNGDGRGVADEIFKKFQNIVERIFNEKFSNFDINWNTMSVYSKIKPINEKKKNFSKKELEKYKNLLDNEMERLKSGMTNFSKNGNLEQIGIAINQLENAIEKVKQTNENFEPQGNFIDDINAAIYAESFPYALAIGDVFENFLGVAQYVLNNNIEKKEDDIIKELSEKIVGTTGKSLVTIDKTKFSEDFVNFNSSGNLYVTDDLTYEITSNKTQDKLDVIFDWNGDTLNITAKNYSLRDDTQQISLVSGTSLLYLIQNENPYFVNHWLNLVSHSNSSGLDLSEGHNAMKITIFAKALTGQLLGRGGEADTFVLNWRAQKKVYVLPVGDIIKAAASNIENMVVIHGYPENGYSLSWVGGPKFDIGNAMQRITFLLGQIRNTKIKVAMDRAAVEKAASLT